MSAAGALAIAGIVAVGSLGDSSQARSARFGAIPLNGSDSGPTVSDDGGVVAFVSDQEGGSLVVVHDRRALTTTPIQGSTGAFRPAVSGDGCTVAWSARDAEQPPVEESTEDTEPENTEPENAEPDDPELEDTDPADTGPEGTEAQDPGAVDGSTAGSPTEAGGSGEEGEEEAASTTDGDTTDTSTVDESDLATPAPFRAPAPAPTSRVLIAQLCGAAPVVVEIASGLDAAQLGRPALSTDGDVIVVSAETQLLRFDNPGPGYQMRPISPPSDQPTALFGPDVDVSDNGSVVVFAAGPDLSDPTSLSVYRSVGEAAAEKISGRAHQSSVSGDGAIVAYTVVGSSETVTVRPDGEIPVILDTGRRPQISADGNHVVYESGNEVRVISWTGSGGKPFGQTDAIALEGLSAPTGSGPDIDRYGSTVVTDTAPPTDIEVTTLATDAGFTAKDDEVPQPDDGQSATARLRFKNDGPASVGVETLTADGSLEIAADGCSPVVRPGSTCTVDVAFQGRPKVGDGGTVSLVPIGVGLRPFTANLVIVAPPTTTTIAPPPTTAAPPATTNPPSTTTPPPVTRPTTGGSTTGGSTTGGSTTGGSTSGSSSFPTSGSSSGSSSFPSSSSSSESSSFPSSSGSTNDDSFPSVTGSVAFSPSTFAFDATGSEIEQLTTVVDLVNGADEPVDVVGVRLEPVGALAFEVVETTCTGAQLPPGGQCDVTVGYTAWQDGPQSVDLIAVLGDGSEVSASVDGVELGPPTLTITPDTATTSQVVTLRGRDFPPGRELSVDWDGAIHSVIVGSDGTFDLPVVVPASERTGPITARISFVDKQFDATFGDVSATMLVTAATNRTRVIVWDSPGPNIGEGRL